MSTLIPGRSAVMLLQSSRLPIRGISPSDSITSIEPGQLRDTSSEASPSPAVRTPKPSALSNLQIKDCTPKSSSTSRITIGSIAGACDLKFVPCMVAREQQGSNRGIPMEKTSSAKGGLLDGHLGNGPLF